MRASTLQPAVGGAPGTVPTRERAQAPTPAGARGSSGAQQTFSQVLGSQLAQPVTEPLRFSAHASARAQSRKLDLGPEQMRRLNEAVDRAAAKGLDDTLILTKDAAFIVSVRNRTVVTAMDRAALEGNVFTNIDGAVVV